MKLLLKPLAQVSVSILVAGVFHIGWLVAFIPAAKSGVMVLKLLGWMAAPVVTALGYAFGLLMGERLMTQRKTDFRRIFVWPLVGCTLGAVALSWVGPMWVGMGILVGGAASAVLWEMNLPGCAGTQGRRLSESPPVLRGGQGGCFVSHPPTTYEFLLDQVIERLMRCRSDWNHS